MWPTGNGDVAHVTTGTNDLMNRVVYAFQGVNSDGTFILFGRSMGENGPSMSKRQKVVGTRGDGLLNGSQFALVKKKE